MSSFEDEIYEEFEPGFHKTISDSGEKSNRNDWIPVSERLPEELEIVIVTDIETSETYPSFYVGNGYWECDNGYFRNRIVAWMPLPEPYKAESEE